LSQVLSKVSRRGFLALAPLALAACTSSRLQPTAGVQPAAYVDPMYLEIYGAMPDEQFPIPAFNPAGVRPELLRQVVPYPTTERSGTIIVDPGARFLSLTRGDGQAVRYGVGVGRAGYDYQGEAYVGRKGQWPSWTPTATMIAENPEVNGPWAGGGAPGRARPPGARGRDH
jgi:lipoprotein-anchoring transpeptidase ErfK/SrfK